jgi:hypothetical protein
VCDLGPHHYKPNPRNGLASDGIDYSLGARQLGSYPGLVLKKRTHLRTPSHTHTIAHPQAWHVHARVLISLCACRHHMYHKVPHVPYVGDRCVMTCAYARAHTRRWPRTRT